ncbi:Asparagine synthetase [glutamine-hydrolyzing] 1 [subsurface metagenome]
MCGICGIMDFRRKPVDLHLLKRMTDILAHRGPDNWGAVVLSEMEGRGVRPITFGDADELVHPVGEHSDYNVGLGHRRLRIIDLSDAARQPMSNEDHSVWVVCNGEIYNYQALSSELKAHGHVFRSHSDTEVIIHLYEEYGERCVDKLRGMFAFALWDADKRSFFLARDRVGKKPLFFFQDRDQFVFSSSLKSILLNPAVTREINPEIIHHFLTYEYNPTNQTIFEGINKLPPGHLLICKNGEITVKEYWDLTDIYNTEAKAHDMEYYSRRILELFEESVRLRLISDVPLGAFLSGGLDSSAIVAMMSQLEDVPVKTFSIGFDDESFSELRYARQVAEHFQTEHHEFIVTPKAIDVLPALVWHSEEPFADPSILPTYYLSKMTREYVTVALSGDGGDESFAGYESYIGEKLVTYYHMIPSYIRNRLIRDTLKKYPESTKRIDLVRRLKRFMEKADMPPERREWRLAFSNDMKRAIYSDDFRQQVEGKDSLALREREFFRIRKADLTTKLLNLDVKIYLPEDLLVKADRASMAHALEVRSPFLDHHLMEFAASIPADMKFRGLTTKYILKKAFSNLLPKKIIHRPKQGFGVPLGSWFRGELKKLSYAVLLDEKAARRGYFKRDAVKALLDEHCSGRFDHGHKIWSLLNLELWHRTFIDSAELSHPSLDL